MRIVFRTDSSLQIGTGHIMRCLTLANELARQGHECRFVCREHEGNLGDLIVSKGYGLTLLPAPAANKRLVGNEDSDNYAAWLGVSWQEDAIQTLSAIETVEPDWLIVDHYALDAKWEKMLVHTVDRIMVIDDLANRKHDCALLLDQNLGRKSSDYDELVPSECQRLIGPSFALLRPEFSALRKQSLARRQTPEFKRILITLGGVDRDNVTGRIMKALEASSLPVDTAIEVVMGKAAPHLAAVKTQAAESPLNITVSVNVSNMAERMCRADLAIGAAGSTSWERCCLGVPSLTVVLADNQQGIANALANAGATKIITPSDLNAFVHDIESMMAVGQNAANICDGLGAQRVCEKIGYLSNA